MKDIIKNKILETNLPEDFKLEIIQSLTDRYLIEAQKSKITLGGSKIGGFPHLPKNVKYPQEDNYFYEFIAQVNLAELIDNQIQELPKKGILYFFIDDDFNVGNVNCKILYFETELNELEIKYPPENKKSRCESFDGRSLNTEMKLDMKKGITIPQKLIQDGVNNYGPDATQLDIESFYTSDQLWGYPANWRIENAEWWAYLTKRKFSSLYYLTDDVQIERLVKDGKNINLWLKEKIGELIVKQNEILLKYNDSSAYIYPYWVRELENLEYTRGHLDTFIGELDGHKLASKKWRQLLSISSYYDANIRFGDGKMEFFINIEDLKVKKFDDVFCHIYS